MFPSLILGKRNNLQSPCTVPLERKDEKTNFLRLWGQLWGVSSGLVKPVSLLIFPDMAHHTPLQLGQAISSLSVSKPRLSCWRTITVSPPFPRTYRKPSLSGEKLGCPMQRHSLVFPRATEVNASNKRPSGHSVQSRRLGVLEKVTRSLHVQGRSPVCLLWMIVHFSSAVYIKIRCWLEKHDYPQCKWQRLRT